MKRFLLSIIIVIAATASAQEVDLSGDVNGDNAVDVADVNAVIDMILGLKDNTPEADVNGDKVVDVADMNAVIDIILSR